MVEGGGTHSSGRGLGWLLAFLALALIGAASLLALRPDLIFWGGSRQLTQVSIAPREAAVMGAQWRLVTQWQGAGDYSEADALYLVEFKPIPGWATPSPVVLKKGDGDVVVEGVYAPLEYSEQTILTLAGSSTLANRLAPELAHFYLTHLGANEVRNLPGKNVGEITVQGIFYSSKEIRTIHIEGQGTESGLSALRAGRCDVAMVAGQAQASDLAIGDGFKVAMDAVAVVVHPSNPVPALTVDEVGRIFRGEIVNWNEVGGPAAPIKVFALSPALGTRDFFEAVFLPGSRLTEQAREVDIHSQLSELVAQDPWAIGFCSIALANQSREVPLKRTPAEDAILPNSSAIRALEYPAARSLFLHHRSDTKNVFAQDFILLSRSPAGQAIVRKYGFVDIGEDLAKDRAESPAAAGRDEEVAEVNSTEAVEPVAGDTAGLGADDPLPVLVQYDNEVVSEETRRRVLREYNAAVRGAEKLPTTFNFDGTSLVLNQEAVKNVNRLVQMMTEGRLTGKKIVVVGFSDSIGNYEANFAIGRKRAEAVAQALRGKGLTDVSIVSAGEEHAVESNETRAGRERNRRVETWVK